MGCEWSQVRVLSPRQSKKAAEMLGIHPETLRRWDIQGRLQAVRIRKRKDRRYKMEDLQKIIVGTNT